MRAYGASSPIESTHRLRTSSKTILSDYSWSDAANKFAFLSGEVSFHVYMSTRSDHMMVGDVIVPFRNISCSLAKYTFMWLILYFGTQEHLGTTHTVETKQLPPGEGALTLLRYTANRSQEHHPTSSGTSTQTMKLPRMNDNQRGYLSTRKSKVLAHVHYLAYTAIHRLPYTH